MPKSNKNTTAMLPPNPSFLWQQQFAEYIKSADPNKLPPNCHKQRFDVYLNLVRNNLASFVDTCFNHSQQHIGSQNWQILKEDFLNNADLKSPYFQDIPQLFYEFVLKNHPLNNGILALMHFELKQLACETAANQKDQPNADLWHAKTILQAAKSGFLLEYDYDFVRDDCQSIHAQKSQILLWRNRQHRVFYQKLDNPNWQLLQYFFSETHPSWPHLKQQLQNQMGDVSAYMDYLQQQIRHWVLEGVLLVNAANC